MASVKIEELDLVSEQSDYASEPSDSAHLDNNLFEATLMGCPVCQYTSGNTTALEVHIEGHFSQVFL